MDDDLRPRPAPGAQPDPASDRSTLVPPVLGALGIGLAAWVFTEAAKEVPVLYAVEPWQDDPYDLVVSTAMWCLPLLGVLVLPRLALCRPGRPVPLSRAQGLLRTAEVLVVAVLVTMGSDLAASALGERRRDWSGTTAGLVAVAAVLAVLAATTARRLRRAAPDRLTRAEAPGPPDWLADVLALACSAAARGALGRGGLLRVVERVDHRVLSRVRAHPLVWAAAVSLVGSGSISAPQLVLEGYGLGLAALYLGVTACSLFTVLTLVGAHVGVVQRRSAAPGWPVRAVVATCASVPLAAAFRGALWWLVGTDGRHAGVPQLGELLAVTTALSGIAVSAWVTAALLLHRRRHP